MWLFSGSLFWRQIACVLALLSLFACTEFRPLHLQSDDSDEGYSEINRLLSSIEVEQVRSRSLQSLRNAVIERLNPAGLKSVPLYRLELKLSRKRRSLAVQLDDSITRFDMTLTSTVTLIELATGQTAYRTAVARTASFNVVGEPFATLVAERDAERRASIEIANQLRALLALHFEKAARQPSP